MLPGAPWTQSAVRASSSLECCSADKTKSEKKGTVAVWRSNTADIAHCQKMIFIKPMWCNKTKAKKKINKKNLLLKIKKNKKTFVVEMMSASYKMCFSENENIP